MLAASNLIILKFFSWSPFGLYTFELSVGMIAYLLTFLIADVISGKYGRKSANSMVTEGLFASAFALTIVIAASGSQAITWSPLGKPEFNKKPGFTYIAVTASFAAYMQAQPGDLKLFHFWKRQTNVKLPGLRNSARTFTSEFANTFVIICLLTASEVPDP